MKYFYYILALILVLILILSFFNLQQYSEGYVNISKIDIQSNFPKQEHEALIRSIPELEKGIKMIKKINIVKKNDFQNNEKPGILKINGKDQGSIEQIYKGLNFPVGFLSRFVDYIDITVQTPNQTYAK